MPIWIDTQEDRELNVCYNISGSWWGFRWKECSLSMKKMNIFQCISCTLEVFLPSSVLIVRPKICTLFKAAITWNETPKYFNSFVCILQNYPQQISFYCCCGKHLAAGTKLTPDTARVTLSREKCLLKPLSLLNFSSERVTVFWTSLPSMLMCVGQSGQTSDTLTGGTEPREERGFEGAHNTIRTEKAATTTIIKI